MSYIGSYSRPMYPGGPGECPDGCGATDGCYNAGGRDRGIDEHESPVFYLMQRRARRNRAIQERQQIPMLDNRNSLVKLQPCGRYHEDKPVPWTCTECDPSLVIDQPGLVVTSGDILAVNEQTCAGCGQQMPARSYVDNITALVWCANCGDERNALEGEQS